MQVVKKDARIMLFDGMTRRFHIYRQIQAHHHDVPSTSAGII